VAADPPDGKDCFLMTTTTAPRGVAVNAQALIKWVGLVFVALASFALAFTHMHDWTRDALPDSAEWMRWANAGISEILPVTSFILWREREEQQRPSNAPLWLFLASAVLSILAQLSATGTRIPGDQYLLACLPSLALLVLAKMILGDISYARKAALAAAAAAERQAELDRAEAQRQAELEAERARKYEREQAELAAELERRNAEHAAELERRRAEREAEERLEFARIEQAAITRREELAAEQRRREWQAQDEAQRRRAEAEAAAFAEAERIRAEAEAERIRAEAERVRAEASAKQQAAALLAGKHRAQADSAERDEATVTSIRQRRPRHETQALAEAALAVVPASARSRADAVEFVAATLGVDKRYAREFVPADWTPDSSAGGEAGAA